MVRTRIVTMAAVFVGLAGLYGCGDGPDSGTAFNRPLGDGPAAAPISGRPVDAGILNDPSSYAPAQFDSISAGGLTGGDAGTPAAGGAAATGGSPDEMAIRELSADLMTAAMEGEVDLVLDCFVDEQVQALRDGEFVDTANDFVSNLEGLFTALAEKTGGTDIAGVEHTQEFVSLLGKLAQGAVKPELVADDAAVLTTDAAGFEAAATSLRPDLVRVMDAMPQQPGGPSTEEALDLAFQQASLALAQPTTLLKLRKVNGEWRIALPRNISEDNADAMNSALLAANDFLTQAQGQLAAQPTPLDEQQMQAFGMSLMPSALGAWGQIQTDLQPMVEEWSESMGAGEGGGRGSAGGGPSFSDDLLPILIDRCAGCHKPGERAYARVPIDLSIEGAYATMTGGQSTDAPGKSFIVAGDVAASYLFEKMISDSPARGAQMPLGDDPLDADELALFEAWILAGAQDN